MNQTIIGMAGKKQSGKNTCYSCIRLWRPEAQDFSFASSLKRMAVDILGLEEWQAFGTDEQKNTVVPHLLWENFPLPCYDRDDGSTYVGYPNGFITKPNFYDVAATASFPLISDEVVKFPEYPCVPPVGKMTFTTSPIPKQEEAWHNGMHLRRKVGPMTSREVLQYWGTEIFRRQYPQVWADACIRKIRKSGCQLAVITDARFPNEVEAVQAAGGKVIRLTRVVYHDDNHPSETALDRENFDWDRFDAVLDNAEMGVDEQCEALYAILRRWGVVDARRVHRIHV